MIRVSQVIFGLTPLLPFLFVAPIAITAATLHHRKNAYPVDTYRYSC